MIYLPYTGVGSRRTPEFATNLMFEMAVYLGKLGLTLRSGHADGADIAFENGADSINASKEIYIPWSGFNRSKFHVGPPPKIWMDMAEKFHPAWNRCSQGAMKLHARNCPQVLGVNLDSPSVFLLCWTEQASGRGGTGQALRIAKHYGVPIFDIGAFKDYNTAKDFAREFFRNHLNAIGRTKH